MLKASGMAAVVLLLLVSACSGGTQPPTTTTRAPIPTVVIVTTATTTAATFATTTTRPTTTTHSLQYRIQSWGADFVLAVTPIVDGFNAAEQKGLKGEWADVGAWCAVTEQKLPDVYVSLNPAPTGELQNLLDAAFEKLGDYLFWCKQGTKSAYANFAAPEWNVFNSLLHQILDILD